MKFPLEFFSRITWNLNYVGKKFHVEISLPDFSMNFLSSVERAAYTRDLRVIESLSERL